MSYVTEFNEWRGTDYQIPEEILNLEGVEDLSWHNDACPSFGFYLEDPATKDNHELRIWVEHPTEPEIDGHRFMVGYCPWSATPCPGLADSQDGKDIWSGNDVREAIKAFVDASAILHRYHRSLS